MTYFSWVEQARFGVQRPGTGAGTGGRAAAASTPGCSTLTLAVHAALGRGLPGQSTGLSLLVFFSVRPRAALLVAMKDQSQLALSNDLLVTCRKIVLPEGRRIWAAVVKPGVSAEGVQDVICLSVCLSDPSLCNASCLLVSCWDITSKNLFAFLKVSQAQSEAAGALTSTYSAIIETTQEEIPSWSRQLLNI